jgi:hypothetical protein
MKSLRHTLIIAAALCLTMPASLPQAAEIKKGTPENPPNAAAVAGTYYCGDGLRFNITLTLNTNGTYAAEWHGCLIELGGTSGRWKLLGKRIVLTPAQESDDTKVKAKTLGKLAALDVLKFNGDWIFVRADDRKSYDERGVIDSSCFQRRKPEKQPAIPPITSLERGLDLSGG